MISTEPIEGLKFLSPRMGTRPYSARTQHAGYLFGVFRPRNSIRGIEGGQHQFTWASDFSGAPLRPAVEGNGFPVWTSGYPVARIEGNFFKKIGKKLKKATKKVGKIYKKAFKTVAPLLGSVAGGLLGTNKLGGMMGFDDPGFGGGQTLQFEEPGPGFTPGFNPNEPSPYGGAGGSSYQPQTLGGNNNVLLIAAAGVAALSFLRR